MRIALAEARLARARGEVPVGAVIADGDGVILARNGNRTRELSDATAHAEILALREVERQAGDFRLDHMNDLTCVVTIEPCLMCLGALFIARVTRVVFGTRDYKFGGLYGRFGLAQSMYFAHWTITEGVLADECHVLLREFFTGLREYNDMKKQ